MDICVMVMFILKTNRLHVFMKIRKVRFHACNGPEEGEAGSSCCYQGSGTYHLVPFLLFRAMESSPPTDKWIKEKESHEDDTYAKKSTGNFSSVFILVCFLCQQMCKCAYCVCKHMDARSSCQLSFSTAFYLSFQRSLTEPRAQYLD